MKIFNAEETREVDRITVRNENITSFQLMQRAANEAFLWCKNNFEDKETVFHIVCGKGNNGGDGLLLAIRLHEDGYTVKTSTVGGSKPSRGHLEALSQFLQAGLSVNNTQFPISGGTKTVVVDAIFGTGLNREPQGDYLQVIESINAMEAFVISLDVPSGLFLNKHTSVAVVANVVLTFQYPKAAFYMAANYKFTGNIEILDIGLDPDYLLKAPSNHFYIDEGEIACRYKPVKFNAHKGTQGHALIIGGSYGKTGAVMLAAKAALKSGCGLVTAYVPECAYLPLQASFPEAMVLTSGLKYIEEIIFNFKPSAIAIGMGLGKEQQTQDALQDFLENNTVPLIVDADALNILSMHQDWLKLLPSQSVLTPHPKELERLIGKWKDDFDRLEKIKQFSFTHKLIIIAKDARTITVSGETVYFNSTGNAALATGGSGDVLAGIITGLAAQGYDMLSAAIVGVYLHGLTANIAITDVAKQSFIASDIINYTGKAFLHVDDYYSSQ